VPVLHWYVGPDRVDAEALAEACTDVSEGAYRLEVERLPTDVDERHAMLVRRLAAKDTSIDLLSLDSAFTAEFAAAQLLAPVPDDLAPAYSEGIAPKALAAATYDDQLVAAPWWFDPQLLWFRGNVAERAGLDTSKPIAWDDLLAGAERLGVTVQIEDRDGSGLAEWVNALVAGAGGTLLEGTGRDATVGLAGDPGREAAAVAEYLAETGVGPGPSPDALTEFASSDGGFLLGSSSIISDPDVAPVAADLGWAAYPTVAGKSVAPLSGVALAVPLYAPESALSYDAITCLTGPESMSALMTNAGHSASRTATYEAEDVVAGYPMAEVTKAAVESGAAVPSTPYWQLVRTALEESWQPLAEVTVDDTPRESQAAVRRRLSGGLE
jgi:multiple sugar transport system substrate-binding protein